MLKKYPLRISMWDGVFDAHIQRQVETLAIQNCRSLYCLTSPANHSELVVSIETLYSMIHVEGYGVDAPMGQKLIAVTGHSLGH